ncbi:hypothetical protein EDB81DRAFT_848494 [Dactylonectria macrodidyma]|uniref:Uncharacterized protein n=1 Tax=Dactylonectria macrodidyma TaxID=307937 RepID=A0A9P9D8L3_9HYPO|nr:hypothetical protein EDB81DRAFT_848494 [Dactylonectria macrodidyma]
MNNEIRPSAESYYAAYVNSFKLWSGLRGQARRNPALLPYAISLNDAFSQHPCLRPDTRINHVRGFSEWGSSWFLLEDRNYVSILMLAWAYVLSARWTELALREGSIIYTDSQVSAPEYPNEDSHQTSPTSIFIGACSFQEARWWAAVLAPGRGQQNPASSTSVSITSRAASSLEAIAFLDKFCYLHELHDQSSAALAAVLLLPSLRGTPSLTLPALKMGGGGLESSCNITSVSSAKAQPGGGDGGQRRRHRMPRHQDVDRLLTLSCHVKGLQSILLGVFFEPGVECNKAGLWLQGALHVADSLVATEPWVLGRMLMDRLPEAAPLWLGVTILGLQQRYIRQVGFGQIPTDLNAAAWSGTMQSFIQEPSADHSGGPAWISPEDHSRAPVCQWAPFGTTAIEQVEQSTLVAPANAPKASTSPCIQRRSVDSTIAGRPGSYLRSSYQKLLMRSIFSWLRPDGYALDEKQIRTYEWLDMPGSDEEEEDEDEDNESEIKSFRHVSLWIENVEYNGLERGKPDLGSARKPGQVRGRGQRYTRPDRQLGPQEAMARAENKTRGLR